MSSIYETKEDTQSAILDAVYASGVFKRYVINPLSRIYTLIRAVANAQHLLVNDKMLRLQQAIHPHTAIHPHDVELWKQRFNLEDKSATYAQHNVRIGSEEPPSENITIPQNSVVKTSDGIQFRTLSSVQLPSTTVADSRGYYTVSVLVVASTAGTIGNVVADSIVEIEDAPSGIDVVYNPEAQPVVAARNDETLAETRARFLSAEILSATQMWTSSWYIAEALAIEDIYRAFYDSALVTGQLGLSRLFVTGKFSGVSQGVMDALYADLNLNPEKTSGSGIVQVLPVTRVDIVRTVTVRFTEAGYLPTQEDLDSAVEKFFLAFERGDDFDTNAFKSIFAVFPGLHSVVSLPDESVAVAATELATIGLGMTVVAKVYI